MADQGPTAGDVSANVADAAAGDAPVTAPVSPPAYECANVECDFLSLSRMRQLSVEDEERKRKIIARCNYHMFTHVLIRGPEYIDSGEWDLVLATFMEDIKPKHFKVNPKLANPPEEFFAKFCKPNIDYSSAIADTAPAKEIKRLLENAVALWDATERAKLLEEAIDLIPHPQRIKKVVCIGFSRIAFISGGSPKFSRETLAQHTAAISIVKQLQEKTGQDIELFAADPQYGANHRTALSTLEGIKFKILDPSYRRHEQFTVIDDSTIVMSMTACGCPTERIVQEFARPVVMICDGTDKDIGYEDPNPAPDVLWYEVKQNVKVHGGRAEVEGGADKNATIAIPGSRWFAPPSKRVEEMFENEYELWKKFPHESKNPVSYPGKFKLVLPEDEDKNLKVGSGNLTQAQKDEDPVFSDNWNPNWNPAVRMYVRKE